MGREGPCFHCGIEYTPLWRSGPPEKPVLCNACGSRWRIRGTLNDYIPKHANKNTQSCQSGKLPLEEKPGIPVKVHKCKKSKLGEKVVRFDHNSACFEDATSNKSSPGSTVSFSDNCFQMGSINGLVAPTISNPQIPRKKRSVLKKRILSPVERRNRQLLQIIHDVPQYSKLGREDEEDIFIFHNTNNQDSSSTEIGLEDAIPIPGYSRYNPFNAEKLEFQFSPPTKENEFQAVGIGVAYNC